MRHLAIVRMSRLFMCLTHMFADLKATGIVARRCIFEERGALKMDIPSTSAKTGTSVALLTGRRATLKRRKWMKI